jgi:glycosyltransferase involved in cell wall biosynthesis
VTASLVSIVIPVHNEADNLRVLLPSLFDRLQALGRPFEVVVVDDGSSDQTEVVLEQFARPELRVIRLRRNAGQTAALMAGFQLSKGDVLVSMDGDCQNDPADIPRLLAKLDE